MNHQKKILITGGGYADIPLIQAAKKLGFFVITSGFFPDDPGHTFADLYIKEDFSNKEAMLKLAQSQNIDAICASCNDFSALSAAYIAEKMGLPGHDDYQTATIIHHKDQYRNFAIEHDIPTPFARSFDNTKAAFDAVDKFSFPLMVKPVDLTGGKGITKVLKKEELEYALERSVEKSKIKRIVVEEFIEGSRHGMSAFLVNGKIVFYFVDNEHYYKNQYMVAAASAPGKVSDDAVKELLSNAEKIANILKLKDGIFHIQFILKQNNPYIIEICRRAPGDLYINLVKHATGVDYPEFIVRAASGLDLSSLCMTDINGFYARSCIMAGQNGIVKNVEIDGSLKDKIIDQYVWWQEGMEIKDFMVQKLGILFIRFENEAEMLEKTENFHDWVKVSIGNK